jgi:anti-anti-sigma regulatory factor
VITTLFDFQAKVRADSSRTLMLDFTNVPYMDSAGIGALGALMSLIRRTVAACI